MDNPNPKVSIIIPAYNHASWITEAIGSVFNQSFTDWELIVIDDASGDHTWDAIGQALGAQPSVKATAIQHTSNQGAPATLNEALSLAQGDYIAILNSDDVWDEQRLEYLYQYARENNVDFLSTGITLWDEHSRLKNASEPDWLSWYQSLYHDWKKSGDFFSTLLRGNFLITTSNFFFHRSLYEHLGGFTELRYMHDYEYALRIYQSGAKMECLWDKALLNYRLHGNNTIREKPLAAIKENIDVLLTFLPKLSQHLNASRLHALRLQLCSLFRYTTEEWKTQVHLGLVEKEKELFALIEDRDAWIAERDVALKTQQKHILERDEWVAERNDWIAERDSLIQRLQNDIVLQQGWIQGT